MEIKFTIKELSNIVGVSARTIRYYDDIELFKCSGTLSNGYRYYNIDKIEEIGIINYLRHMGIPIKDIKKQLENRDIDEYSLILDKQLNKVASEISKLEKIQDTIEKRISSVNFIRNLPPIGQITITSLPAKRIIKLKRKLTSQIDWELALKDLEVKTGNFPSIFIGDLGFFVDLKNARTRGGEEFSAMFLLVDNPIYASFENTQLLEKSKYLSLYIKGDHNDASNYYNDILDYADNNKLTLGEFALERTLIDHYISNDENLHITEILIPIIS